jgi:hypothetical protein
MEFLGALNRRADWQGGQCLPFTRLERRKSLTIGLGSVAASHTSRGISQIQSRARSAPRDHDDVVRSLRSGAYAGPVDEDNAKRQHLQPRRQRQRGCDGCASAYSATMNGAVASPYALPFGTRASGDFGRRCKLRPVGSDPSH